jgi:diacylglycerol O-acyltransferase
MSAGPVFSVRREVAVGLGTYAVYLAVRALIVNDRGRRAALRNAGRVVAAERWLGIHLEPHLQRVSLSRRRALAVANVSYVTLNVALTVGWLMLLYARRDRHFHRFRRAWVLATLGPQPAHLLFPTAPPRGLEGFTDTIREAGIDLESGWVAYTYNPLAAMPSIHMAYAEVTSASIAERARSPLVRRLARAYPPAVALIVLATANHFVLDVVGGSLLGRASLALAKGRRR